MDVVTIEEIRELMDTAEEACHDRGVPFLSILNALRAVTVKLEEIEKKFNKHGHFVQVSKHSDYYQNSGSGFTSTPKEGGSYGCHKDIEIGHKPPPDWRDNG
jgi:hypothetical protein